MAASDGTIWMGTINGLVSFNPQIVHPNTFVPPVYITGMYVQGRETPFTADGVQLPYRSNVSFDFVALSYTSPGANRYAYKMEGIDNDWNYTSDVHRSHFVGTYSSTLVAYSVGLPYLYHCSVRQLCLDSSRLSPPGSTKDP